MAVFTLKYLFYGKELDALDHEGHTLYIRHQKGELGRRLSSYIFRPAPAGTRNQWVQLH